MALGNTEIEVPKKYWKLLRTKVPKFTFILYYVLTCQFPCEYFSHNPICSKLMYIYVVLLSFPYSWPWHSCQVPNFVQTLCTCIFPIFLSSLSWGWLNMKFWGGGGNGTCSREFCKIYVYKVLAKKISDVTKWERDGTLENYEDEEYTSKLSDT